MISKMAYRITAWLIKCEVVEEADRELYEYAIHSLWLNVAPIILVLVYGIAMQKVYQSILFIIPFLSIRKYSGGFHAKREVTCFIISSVVLATCVYLTGSLQCEMVLHILVVVSVFILVVFSPIDSENRRLDADERKIFKKVTIIGSLFWMSFYVVCVVLQYEKSAVSIAIGIMLTAGVQLPCLAQSCLERTKSILKIE